jgi:hypothetical protein
LTRTGKGFAVLTSKYRIEGTFVRQLSGSTMEPNKDRHGYDGMDPVGLQVGGLPALVRQGMGMSPGVVLQDQLTEPAAVASKRLITSRQLEIEGSVRVGTLG